MGLPELFAEIQEKLDAHPDKLEGFEAKFQFKISGVGGGDYYAVVADGKGKVDKGVVDCPDLTVLVSAKDFVDLFNGKIDPMRAYISGRLRMQGDMSLALKINSILSRYKD